MNTARTTTRQGTRSGADPARDRVPEKHEEGHSSSIAELAYRLYEERGRREGHQLEDWIEAESRLGQEGSRERVAS
jgi:hypothetical protein